MDRPFAVRRAFLVHTQACCPRLTAEDGCLPERVRVLPCVVSPSPCRTCLPGTRRCHCQLGTSKCQVERLQVRCSEAKLLRVKAAGTAFPKELVSHPLVPHKAREASPTEATAYIAFSNHLLSTRSLSVSISATVSFSATGSCMCRCVYAYQHTPAVHVQHNAEPYSLCWCFRCAGTYTGRFLMPNMLSLSLPLSVCWCPPLLAGTYTGQFLMGGFLKLRVSPWTRILLTRSVAILPTLAVAIAYRDSSTSLDTLNQSLNLLQSVQLPFALIPVGVGGCWCHCLLRQDLFESSEILRCNESLQ